ncbi:MAG: AbrB/MazE/SpoVT family DNA-binding domain-containing protein [bacterium]
MTTTIRKWGNSLGLRIPQDIAEGTGISEGKEVVFIKNKGGLSIQPVTEPKVSLDALLRKITPKNKHEEVEWGAPRGKEIW